MCRDARFLAGRQPEKVLAHLVNDRTESANEWTVIVVAMLVVPRHTMENQTP